MSRWINDRPRLTRFFASSSFTLGVIFALSHACSRWEREKRVKASDAFIRVIRGVGKCVRKEAGFSKKRFTDFDLWVMKRLLRFNKKGDQLVNVQGGHTFCTIFLLSVKIFRFYLVPLFYDCANLTMKKVGDHVWGAALRVESRPPAIMRDILFALEKKQERNCKEICSLSLFWPCAT